MAYITTAELRAHLGYRPEFVEDDVQIAAAIASAEAAVDNWCGRTFTVDTVATARTYELCTLPLTVEDVSTTTGVVVAHSTDRITFTTLDAATYFFEPTKSGWPATTWQVLSSPGAGWIKVTALHGWTAVPEVVDMSVKLVAAQLLSRRHSPNGIEGIGEFGVARASQYLDSTAKLLLAPYRRVEAFAGIA